MTSNVEMREVEKFFNSKGITIYSGNVWFRSCVECFRSQCTSYAHKELIDFVFEQWLLADLKEVGCSTLPKECSTHEKFTLLGNHAVQLNYSIDVSTSSYSQFQKIRKPDFGLNLNIESERDNEEQSYFHKKSEKRSLKLEITDGQLTVIGFEDKPIPCLKNPVPGEKALLKGPIECRMGVLMLTEKNIEILGGEVDTLLIPNALVNVLARALGEPEDPDPYKQNLESTNDDGKEIISSYLEDDDEALLLLAESMDAETLPPSNLTNSGTLISSNVEDSVVSDNFENFEDDDFDLVAAQTASMAEIEAARQKNSSNSEVGNTTAEISILNKISAQGSNAFASTTVQKSSSSPEIVDYVDMNDPKRLKMELEQSYGRGAAHHRIQLEQKSRLSETNKSTAINRSSSLIAGTSLNRSDEKDAESLNLCGSSLAFSSNSKRKVNVEEEFSSTKISSVREIKQEEKQMEVLDSSNFDDSPSWMTPDIAEDLDMDLSEPEDNSNENVTFHQPYPPRKFPAIRVVRGRVVQVCEKLSLKNDEWCLGVIVSANGLDLEMTFASEVLDKIFGITAAELMARRREIKTNPAAKEQINKTLRDSQLRIKNLNCEMVIRFSSVIAKPVIIDVIQK